MPVLTPITHYQIHRSVICVFVVAVATLYLKAAGTASVCQQQNAYPTSDKANFSFCCCRTLRIITIDVNVTSNLTADLTYVLINRGPGTYKKITDLNETLYDSSTMTCFSSDVTVIDSRTKDIAECHCTNTHSNLNQHRQTTSQTEGITCPKPKIFIGGFFDLHSISGLQTLPAAQIALEEINTSGLYFPEYELVLVNDNSTNNGLHNYGSHILLNHLFEKPYKTFFLGPSYNLLAKTVAAAASLDQYNVIQISSKTDDLELTHDRVAYKNFFRTYPSIQEINDARIRVILYYKWKNVGLLYSSEPFYQRLNEILKEKLEVNGINVVFQASFHSNPAGAIKDIKDHGVKIIFGSYPEMYSSSVFCQIYCQEMFSPLYVFLMMHQFNPVASDVCSAEKVGCAARHQFFFDSVPAYLENNTKIIQYRNGFLGKYKARVPASYLTTLTDAYYMYDTVWTMADILQRAKLTLEFSNVNLDQIKYGKTAPRALLRSLLLTTDWFGLTGRIRFHSSGDRYSDVSISQNLGGTVYADIGEYETKYSVLRLRDVRWLGWKPHRDVFIERIYRYVNSDLHLCLVVLAFIGMLFAFVLFVYIIVRRKTYFIKNSYWQINLFVIVGAALVYASIIPFVSDSSSNLLVLTGYEICLLRKVLFCIGATLIIGALAVKLHVAFRVSRKNLCFVERGAMRRMFVYLFLVVMVTAIILVLWCLLSPFEMILKEIEEKKEILCSTFEINFDPFVRVITYVNACSEFSYPFAAMIVWLICLTLITLYMAVKTRHTFITTMTDTWQCGLCVYVITFFAVVGVLCGFLAVALPSVFAGVVGVTIWVCVTAVLLILFLHVLLSDPSKCCVKLSSCLCCCAVCGYCCGGRGFCKACRGHNDDDNSLTKQDDLAMFQRYHNRLPSSPNESLSSKTSGNASLNDVDLQGSSSSPMKNKQKGKKGCMEKMCCCSESLSWMMRGAPDAKESGDNNNDPYSKSRKRKSRGGRVIYKGGRRKRRTIATQTEGKYKVNNNGNSIELQLTDFDENADAGDGLKKYNDAKENYVPLKIYDKKPDWSHVRSHLEVNGITRKRDFTGDISSLQSNKTDNDAKVHGGKANSGIFVISNHNAANDGEDSSKTPSLSSAGTLDSGGGPRKSGKAVVIPTHKHDYSHVKSTVNSGLSPGQVRRANNRAIHDKASPNSQRGNMMVRSKLDGKKTPLLSRSKNNLDDKDKKPVIHVSDSSEAAQATPPPVRIVNGPGSKSAPEQPNNLFLQKKVTTLANTSSGLPNAVYDA